VEERHSVAERDEFLKDLSFPRPTSLDRKLRSWPKKYLGTPLDLSSGPASEFMVLKSLRNSIIHFTSTHEEFEYEGVSIQGLADTSSYDALDSVKAGWALKTAEELVAEIFRIAETSENDLSRLLHAWTGKAHVSKTAS
jgi:hypothetical protein